MTLTALLIILATATVAFITGLAVGAQLASATIDDRRNAR